MAKPRQAAAKSARGKAGQKPGPKRYSKKPARRSLWLALGVPAALVFLLVVGGFSFAASTEERDVFCSSCHTQPESTFYQRSLASAAPTDLATFHHTKDTKCIDCHSGPGVFGRVGAIMLGSRNALAFFTNTATQPAPLTVPIDDGNCIKCHQQVMARQDFNNHFHAFLQRWQALDPQAAGCVSCHSAHTTTGDSTIAFLDQQTTGQVCQACHNRLGGGD